MISFRPAAVAALSIATAIACTGEKAVPARSSRVLVGEIRLPSAAQGTAITQYVPDAQDGRANQNPPGTVEVVGPALQVDSGNNPPCNERSLYSPVAVKSYATETLNDVQVEFEMLSGSGIRVCNLPPADPLHASTIGVIAYGNLAGSSAPGWVPGTLTTIDPGGVATVTWSFNYPVGLTTFSFRAKVYADMIPAVPTNLAPNDPATRLCRNTLDCGTNLNMPVLTWSGTTESAYLQISDSPAFATTVETAVVAGGAPVNGVYPFSYTIAAPGPGGARYWRVFSRWSDDGGTTWKIGTFSSATARFEMEPEPYGLWNELVLAGTTFRHHASSEAPVVEFWQWGWDVYLDVWHVIRADAHSYYTGQYDAAGPDFWVENEFHGMGEFMNFPISADHPVSWGACNQWGSVGDATRLGACVRGPDFTGQ